VAVQGNLDPEAAFAPWPVLEAKVQAVLDAIATLSLASLRSQVQAGAKAFQLFDSWAGALSVADYRASVLPASQRIFAGMADLGVPGIHFGVATGELLTSMAEAGADVVGVDWRVPLDAARDRLGPDVAVQGNLDPEAAFAPWPVLEAKVHAVLDANHGRPGHIFNLGHGVLPDTDPDQLSRVVEAVHAAGAPGARQTQG
jgi:uroporphyrinogen decarboxylase